MVVLSVGWCFVFVCLLATLPAFSLLVGLACLPGTLACCSLPALAPVRGDLGCLFACLFVVGVMLAGCITRH